MYETDNENEDISDLIANSESVKEELAVADATAVKEEGAEEKKDVESAEGKFFKKYKIKDIVFLAIITACTLVTGAVMPAVTGVSFFGIIQLALGLQFSILPVIGLMKVRKPGALFFQSAIMAIFLAFMFTPMALIVLCGLIAEAVALAIFRGYKNDWACVVAGTLYMPLTIPLMLLFGNVLKAFDVTNLGVAASVFFGMDNVGIVIGVSCAVVAECFIGAVIGMIISRELKKAGKFK